MFHLLRKFPGRQKKDIFCFCGRRLEDEKYGIISIKIYYEKLFKGAVCKLCLKNLYKYDYLYCEYYNFVDFCKTKKPINNFIKVIKNCKK